MPVENQPGRNQDDNKDNEHRHYLHSFWCRKKAKIISVAIVNDTEVIISDNKFVVKNLHTYAFMYSIRK